MTVGGTATITGETTISNTANVTSNLTVGGTTTVSNLTVNGTVNFTSTSTTGNVGIRKAADANYALDINAQSLELGAGIRVAHATNTNLEGLRIKNPSGEFTVNIANATNAFQAGAGVGDVILRSEKSKLMLSSALNNTGIQPGIAIQGASVGIGANPDMGKRLTVSGITKFANGTVDYVTSNNSTFSQYFANAEGGGLNANHLALWSYPIGGGTIQVYNIAPGGRMHISEAYIGTCYAGTGVQVKHQMVLGFLGDWGGGDDLIYYTESTIWLRHRDAANTLWQGPRTVVNLYNDGNPNPYTYYNYSYTTWLMQDVASDIFEYFTAYYH